MQLSMEPCQNHTWRRATDWRQEEGGDGWSVQRLYRVVRCTSCSEQTFIQPLTKRRRYRTDRSSTADPSLFDHLSKTRWRALDTLIRDLHRNRLDLLDLLSEWLESGWVEVEEKLVNQDWQIDQARIAPPLAAERAEQRHLVQDAREKQAVKRLATVLKGWRRDYQAAIDKHCEEGDLLEILTRLYHLLDEQENALATGRCAPLTGTTMLRGGLPHQRWVALLRGIVDLFASPRIEHERVFSARWLQDSKAFRKERAALKKFLAIPGGFERIGLVQHTPVVLSWGAWRATFMDYIIDGRAAFTFTSTPADTIAYLQGMQVAADSLLIVENRSPFEFLVHPRRRQANTLYMDGAGFPGHAERELVARWLRAKPTLPWFVWTDFDIGGVSIQRHWHDWARQEQLPLPRPYRWTREDLSDCHVLGVPLNNEQREKLERMNHPLAQLLCECGYTMEQEAVLSAHEDW